LVKEVEQLMNDESLKKLKILWEKLDDIEKNQNQDKNSLVNDLSHYKKKSKWLPPDFAKLSVQNHNSETSKLFSMAYNKEERINRSSPNVN